MSMGLLAGAVVVLAAGCGRLDFAPVATADATATADAAPIACATEDAPCDDGNICTATSQCQAGVCVGTGPTTCLVARARDEFADTQGTDGWHYGVWRRTADADGVYGASDFEPLVFQASAWRPAGWEPEPSAAFSWAYLMWWGGHPATVPEVLLPIRRWVSDVQGRAIADVTLRKADLGGDGVQVLLYVDGVLAFSRAIAGDDGVGFSAAVPIDLAIGSTVDYVFDALELEAQDTSDHDLAIRSP